MVTAGLELAQSGLPKREAFEEDATSFLLLRVLRVLRPLRTFNRLPTVRMLVHVFLQTLPKLLQLMLVAAFLSTFWSIFGVNLFSDAYMQRCRVLSHPTDDGAWPHDMLQPGPCSASPLSGYQCRAANAEILAHYIAKLCDEDPMPMWEYCWLLSFPSIRNSIAIKKVKKFIRDG